MLRSGQQVVVKGFFAASRVGVVINGGSWWSGLCHILFDGDQTVTAVPRRLVTHEVVAKAEDFNQLEQYCKADVAAEKGFMTGGFVSPGEFAEPFGKDTPCRPILPRDTVKSPLFAAPYGGARIDFFNAQFKNRPHVVDMRTGRVMKWRGVRTMPGAALYCEFECRGKVLTFPAVDVCEAIESSRFIAHPSNKKAREAIQAVDIQAHFWPGKFVLFDGSFRLYQVEDLTDHSVEGVSFCLSLCCEDETAKPFKTVYLDQMAQCFRSGHTVVYPDYQTALADLSDKSPMVYFDPATEERF